MPIVLHGGLGGQLPGGRDQRPCGVLSKSSINREGRACLVRTPYLTITTVPTGISAKSRRATSPGSRMQPWDAG